MASVVCAITSFIRENNEHSSYNIGTLVESAGALGLKQLTIVANGCPPSATLQEHSGKFPFVSIKQTSRNIGVPEAWNLGLESLASCRYVLILNDDVWLDRICVEKLASVFERYPHTAVAGVEGVVCSGTDENGFPRQQRRFGRKKWVWPWGLVKTVSNVSGFLFMLSMDFIKKTGFRFDTRYTPAFCEEFDCAFFARQHGYRTRIMRGLGAHYDHVFGISSSNQTIHYLDTSITTQELSRRNMRLFCEKWEKEMARLIKP